MQAIGVGGEGRGYGDATPVDFDQGLVFAHPAAAAACQYPAGPAPIARG